MAKRLYLVRSSLTYGMDCLSFDDHFGPHGRPLIHCLHNYVTRHHGLFRCGHATACKIEIGSRRLSVCRLSVASKQSIVKTSGSCASPSVLSFPNASCRLYLSAGIIVTILCHNTKENLQCRKAEVRYIRSVSLVGFSLNKAQCKQDCVVALRDNELDFFQRGSP